MVKRHFFCQNIVKCSQNTYKSDLKICFTSITSISKLRIILRNQIIIFSFLIQKYKMHCKPARQKAIQNRFTNGHRVPSANSQFIYLILTFRIKKVIIIFLKIFNYQVLIESRKGNPVLPSQLLLYFTLIFDNCIFQLKR